MSFARIADHIDSAPLGGPHALPLAWRVLDELVGIWDMTASSVISPESQDFRAGL